MLELLEQYIFSLFLTIPFVWLPLHIMNYYIIHNFYKEDEERVKFDNGKSLKKSTKLISILSILFLSAILLFVYRVN